MKVKDLIERLQKYNPELHVWSRLVGEPEEVGATLKTHELTESDVSGYREYHRIGEVVMIISLEREPFFPTTI